MAIYDDVVTIARPYLGPATEKFLRRQLSRHLNLADANAVDHGDLDDLSRWCFSSARLLMDDSKAQAFSNEVKGLKQD